MDGPYRLTTRKTSKDRILGHWYYHYPILRDAIRRGENPKHIKLGIWVISCFLDHQNIFTNHEKAKYWSDKNKLTPNQVSLSSGKKFWFDCDKCPHDFKSRLNHVNRGKWCPYCSNRRLCEDIKCKFCLKKSFASHPKAKYWSKRNTLKPTPSHFKPLVKKFWFDCDKCPHDFEASLNAVTSHSTRRGIPQKGTWCPYCVSKKFCGDIECQFCFKKSFASHEKSKIFGLRKINYPQPSCFNLR